jgi:hypothetical protein
VAYNAYNRCRGKDDDQGTVVWGENLRIAQQETGVHLHGDNLIDSIKRARRQIAEDRTLESYRLADEARARLAAARAVAKAAAAKRREDRTARKAAAKAAWAAPTKPIDHEAARRPYLGRTVRAAVVAPQELIAALKCSDAGYDDDEGGES